MNSCIFKVLKHKDKKIFNFRARTRKIFINKKLIVKRKIFIEFPVLCLTVLVV